MPPKPKCSKEIIAKTAFEIVKEQGLSALSVREIGKRLGVSASPIFTVFSNMDEVKLAARELALEEFKELVSDYKEYTPAFKRIGMMIISYGINEPELFKLLFMQEHNEPFGFQNTINDLGNLYSTCIDLIMQDYQLSKGDATLLFEQMWTISYGLGAMCAMKVCSFSEEEIGKRLSIAFSGHIMLIKSGNLDKAYVAIEKKKDSNDQKALLTEFPFG